MHLYVSVTWRYKESNSSKRVILCFLNYSCDTLLRLLRICRPPKTVSQQLFMQHLDGEQRGLWINTTNSEWAEKHMTFPTLAKKVTFVALTDFMRIFSKLLLQLRNQRPLGLPRVVRASVLNRLNRLSIIVSEIYKVILCEY